MKFKLILITTFLLNISYMDLNLNAKHDVKHQEEQQQQKVDNDEFFTEEDFKKALITQISSKKGFESFYDHIVHYVAEVRKNTYNREDKILSYQYSLLKRIYIYALEDINTFKNKRIHHVIYNLERIHEANLERTHKKRKEILDFDKKNKNLTNKKKMAINLQNQREYEYDSNELLFIETLQNGQRNVIL